MAGDGCWWSENPRYQRWKLVSKALAAVGSSTVTASGLVWFLVPLDLRPMVAEYGEQAEFE